MDSMMWRERIGPSAWDALLRVEAEPHPEYLAALLTRAHELGMQIPSKTPVVTGGRVVFEGEGGVLTAQGLLRFWKTKGHQFLLLDLDVLLAAVAGPLLPRLQELLAAYQGELDRRGQSSLPPWADITVFVGGDHPTSQGRLQRLMDGLYAARLPPASHPTGTARRVDP